MMKLTLPLRWIIALLIFVFLFIWVDLTSPPENYDSPYLTFTYPKGWFISTGDHWQSDFATAVGKMQKTRPYESLLENNNLIKFNFPAQWLIRQDNFPGEEIRNNIYLISPDEKDVCLIQVWKIDKPLINFIQDIQNNPASGEKITNFSVTDANINGKDGFLVEYQYQDLWCKEFYFLNQDYMYRVAYLFSGPQWTKKEEENFQLILTSLVVKTAL